MKYVLLCALCMLSACSSTRLVPEIVEKPPLAIADPDPIDLQDVKFVIIHKDNAERVFAELAAKGIDPVVFALTGDDYKALATDMQDIKGYIKLQKKILQLYRDYYEQRKENIKEEPKEESSFLGRIFGF